MFSSFLLLLLLAHRLLLPLMLLLLLRLFVYCSLRASSVAEFSRKPEPTPEIVTSLFHTASKTMPLAAQWDKSQMWRGVRPVSADGLPIVSRTPLDNAFMNAGHGSGAFKTALGCGRCCLCGTSPLLLSRTLELSNSASLSLLFFCVAILPSRHLCSASFVHLLFPHSSVGYVMSAILSGSNHTTRGVPLAPLRMNRF
jgi:FAD dependent oxidoreductase